MLTKKEAGKIIFLQTKNWLQANGYSLNAKKFPADFPVSRRSVYNLNAGLFSIDLVKKLPFRVEISYIEEIPADLNKPEVTSSPPPID